MECPQRSLPFSPSHSKMLWLYEQFVIISFSWFVWVFCSFSAISDLIDSGERKVLFPLFFLLNFSPPDWGTATLSDSWIYLHCRRKCLEHCLSDITPGQVLHPTNLNHCLLTSIQVRLDEQIAITRCHKSVRGTSKWVKRELLEMEEGRSKEEAKHLLKVM